MSEKRLHIISFDVPLPADYGGAIDVFYRLKALSELGVKITLHCYEYGRGESKELERYADRVFYYPRKKKLLDVLNRLPFIVKTRDSKTLINNLLLDNDPILFEGLHTTFSLGDERFKARLKIVRMHNIEHEYYEGLSAQANGFRKKFYASESKKLKRYEPKLKGANCILAIKEDEALHFMQYCKNTKVLPACADIDPDYSVATKPYCLYQGNLSVPENESGLIWLIEHVFLPHNLINRLKVAGKSPSEGLIALCKSHGIELVKNPSAEEMQQLISEASVHVFYTNQDSGIKLKLVNTLRSPGAIIANKKMLAGAEFENLCIEANSPEEYAKFIELHLLKPVAQIHLELRQSFLRNHLNPVKNCQIIFDQL